VCIWLRERRRESLRGVSRTQAVGRGSRAYSGKTTDATLASTTTLCSLHDCTRSDSGRSMRFLSSDECTEWCESVGAPLPTELRATSPAHGLTKTNFSIPADAGHRVALCNLLWNLDPPGTREETLVWITDWSVWPSGEHMPLFLKWRAAFGESRPLIEAPGLLMQSGDADGLSTLVVCALFLWDCWMYTGSQMIVLLSHDGFGTLYEPIDRVMSDRRSALAAFAGVEGSRID
jgi:hypothetical protein